MAEYFPLLERAVAGLKISTPEARKALYERARTALLGQLRQSDPPVPESDIERESVALDEAIARVEANARASQASVPSEESDPAPPIAPTTPPPMVGPAAGPPAAITPGLPTGIRQTALRPPRPSLDRGPPADAAGPAASVAPGRDRPAYPFRNLDPGLVAARPVPPVRPVPIEVEAKGDTTAPRLGAAVRSVDPDAAASNGVVEEPGQLRPMQPNGRPVALGGLAQEADTSETAEPSTKPEDLSRRDKQARKRGQEASAIRPAAPVRSEREPRRRGVYVVLLAFALLVGGVAIAAYLLRDRPERLVAARPDVAVGDDASNKVATRVETPAKSLDQAADRPAQAATGPAEAPVTPSDTATLPAPIAQGSERASRGPQSASTADTGAADATAGSGATTPTPEIGVSQRAGMLVDAPEDPQKVKTYPGSVVWRMDSVSAGQGQPLSNAVRADVDIPDAKLTMSMVLKRNVEPQFPASHTIEFHFTEQPGNTLGPVKQINVPELRRDDSSPNGDPLAGVPVSITDDYFLVGLSRGAAEQSNLQLLSQRNWIDVSIMLASGKIAKVAFEKGAPGQKILEDAQASWH